LQVDGSLSRLLPPTAARAVHRGFIGRLFLTLLGLQLCPGCRRPRQRMQDSAFSRLHDRRVFPVIAPALPKSHPPCIPCPASAGRTRVSLRAAPPRAGSARRGRLPDLCRARASAPLYTLRHA